MTKKLLAFMAVLMLGVGVFPHAEAAEKLKEPEVKILGCIPTAGLILGVPTKEGVRPLTMPEGCRCFMEINGAEVISTTPMPDKMCVDLAPKRPEAEKIDI